MQPTGRAGAGPEGLKLMRKSLGRHQPENRVRYHGVIGLVVIFNACAPTRAGRGPLSPAPTLSPEVERAVHVAALKSAQFFLNLPTPFCIVLERGSARRDPEPELLRALAMQPPAVPMNQCPPTYGSWVITVDSAGRPLGPAATWIHRPIPTGCKSRRSNCAGSRYRPDRRLTGYPLLDTVL